MATESGNAQRTTKSVRRDISSEPGSKAAIWITKRLVNHIFTINFNVFAIQLFLMSYYWLYEMLTTEGFKREFDRDDGTTLAEHSIVQHKYWFREFCGHWLERHRDSWEVRTQS